MNLRGIVLQNFRSYQSGVFEFRDGINLIVGKNGSGKSNLLESIFFLASGKSFRASSLKQLISWQAKFGIVSGKVEGENGETKLESQLIINF
jgi:DNA replication and repair protein RecF